MELSLSTPKNRPSTYCTSLSLSTQIKCTPITTKKRRGRWERQRADSTCSSQRWFWLFVNQEVLFSHKAWRGFLATILLHLGAKPPRTSVSPSLATSSIQHSCPGFQEEQGPNSPGQAAELDSINPTHHASTDPPLPAALLWATAGSLFQHNLILRLSALCWPVNPNCISYKPVRTAGLTPRD